MAIKILQDAGFEKDSHILTLIHRGPETLAEVRTKDEDGRFFTFTSALPVAKALDAIRCLHNGEVNQGRIGAAEYMPKTPEVAAALARVYLVEHLI